MKKKAIIKDLWIIVLDIIAVNLSYYLALFIRFYKNGVFHGTTAKYLDSFYHIAPWYTVIAIVIFFAFKLYGGMWVYAGLRSSTSKSIFLFESSTIASGTDTFFSAYFNNKS